MVDKIKPLKIEDLNSGGDDIDLTPTETDPNEDYLSTKGLVFENDDNTRIEKASDGNIQIVTVPTGTLKIVNPIPLIIALG